MAKPKPIVPLPKQFAPGTTFSTTVLLRPRGTGVDVEWPDGRNLAVPEPVLRDYKNIECRDAVLAYDREELVRDEKGKPVTRWDGITFKKSPVTGEDVPDEGARSPVYEYTNPKPARWPKADFIIGNPPFVGNKRMLSALGEGYVSALRKAHSSVPDSADLVMYWWNLAAGLVSSGQVERAGLITTNSISQAFNRRVVEAWLSNKEPVSLSFAVPDHPWVDSKDGAAVRIAMTVIQKGVGPGTLAKVLSEQDVPGDDARHVSIREAQGVLGAGLSVTRDAKGASALRANSLLCGQGMKVVGDGFYVEADFEADVSGSDKSVHVVRRIINPQDILRARQPRHIIDFFGLDETQARQLSPKAYQRVRDRVKPLRDQNKRASIRDLWWRFAWERPVLRRALDGLSRYFVTLETSKHRFFVSVPPNVLWDGSLFAIASDDWSVGGILSSRAHSVWALAAGSRLGVGNDPRYTGRRCFDTFPFPTCTPQQRLVIASLAKQIDAHRQACQRQHPELTITHMYNVLEKLHSGAALNDNDKTMHEQGLVSVLKKLHDDLDAAVFDAYGWPHDLTAEQILERLVSLNAERAAEEQNGLIRWLRPEFQNPAGASVQVPMAEGEEEDGLKLSSSEPAKATPWPKKLSEQVAVLRDLVRRSTASWTASQVASAFKGAKPKDVEPVLDSLAALGIVIAYDTDGRRWQAP